MKLRYLLCLPVLLTGCSPEQFVMECRIAGVGGDGGAPKEAFRGKRSIDLKNKTVDNHDASISNEYIVWANERGALYKLDRKTGNLSVGEQVPGEPGRVIERYSGHCERKDKGRFERWFGS